MTFELDLLKDVCSRLNQANISYMLTGSCAANFYAVPRMTRDIDIIIAIQESELNILLNLFQKDFYIEKSAIQEALQHHGMFNIIHHESVFKIDFIILKNEVYRETEFQRKSSIIFDEIPIWIVSPEDLIISKLFWAQDSMSTMQLNDVKNLIRSIKNLDYSYMELWIKKLELNSIYEKVRNA